MAGAVGGMFTAEFTGFILPTTGGYFPLFAVCSSGPMIALLIIHLLVRRFGVQTNATA